MSWKCLQLFNSYTIASTPLSHGELNSHLTTPVLTGLLCAPASQANRGIGAGDGSEPKRAIAVFANVTCGNTHSTPPGAQGSLEL